MRNIDVPPEIQERLEDDDPYLPVFEDRDNTNDLLEWIDSMLKPFGLEVVIYNTDEEQWAWVFKIDRRQQQVAP
jgi:hypothetical protein